MRRIEILLYRADKQDKHKADDFIAAYTGLFPCNYGTRPYSHVEIGLQQSCGNVRCFSSTSRDYLLGKNGTRWIDKPDLFENPDRWDVYYKMATPAGIELMEERANSIVGLLYDWLGILGFAFPFGILHDPYRWYCSEAVYYVLTGKRIRVSPRRLSKLIKKMGFQLEADR